ncbi:MAG: Methyltransferase type 12 [Acidimicrobiia bacterium]|nr:Methyltransferase type 12 [Acidimicrobiia bacterium]
MTINQSKLDEFLGRFVGDLGATMSAPLVVIGDRLGLYKVLADDGPQTPAQLAQTAGCSERYVREWLSNQAAGGYVEYNPAQGTFWLTEEQAMCLADENSPAFIPGGLLLAMSTIKDYELIQERFRTGAGLGWHEHHQDLFAGTERFFRPGYLGNLTTGWLPALTGVEAALAAGVSVADVGCGHGASTIIMAQAYPASTFVGFDYHAASIDAARKRAAEAGVSDRVRFEVASAQNFPGHDYALVAFFDCLHDMSDPVGAARHVRDTLAPGGTWMIVEPFANGSLEENLNPVGRIFYGASTTICSPAGLLDDGMGLGNQVSDDAWRELLGSAGFGHVRRAAETPFNRVFEVRA